VIIKDEKDRTAPQCLANKKNTNPSRNISSLLNHNLITEKKRDPEEWAKFLACGRTLVLLVKQLSSL
jgi:hypothetical protein